MLAHTSEYIRKAYDISNEPGSVANGTLPGVMTQDHLACARFLARGAEDDLALLGLCRAVQAPPALWSGDRA